MSTLATVSQFIESGRFSEALRALNTSRITPKEKETADVLRAELLERTGNYCDSRDLTQDLLRRRLSDRERAAVEMVVARLELEFGHINSGISHLQRSIAAALRCNNLSRVCWSELRLLLVLCDSCGPESVTPLLCELRSHVLQTADPVLVAALHIHLAETEAKRGWLNNAERHLKMARTGLSQFPNQWLQAVTENVQSAIEMMRSDFGSALSHARKCLELANDAGVVALQKSALGNLGNLSFIASRLDEAASFLLQTTATLKGSEIWLACIETLARVRLAENDLSECQRLLDEIDAIVISDDDRSRYVYRHSQLTRVRLLSRLKRVDDAIHHLEVVTSLATRSGDQFLRDLAVLSRADVLQEANRVSESVALLGTLVSAIPSRPPDFLAHYERIVACGMARTGEYKSAEHHRRRSERIYAALRHTEGQVELTRSWNDAKSIPRHTTIKSASVSAIPTPVASTLGSVASIMMHGERPELVACEFIDLLDASHSVDYAEALASTDGATEVLVKIGDKRNRNVEQRIPIGVQDNKHIEIVITPKSDLESITAVHSVSLLIATLREIEQARTDREERANLWPLDELPSSGQGGAVTVSHMREVMGLAKKVSNANISVLITGESGTGKEVVARAIHSHSGRAQKPFVPFNCAAVPRDLVESQLFGHRRGAFTGAERDSPGVIRSARDGTLFLDEIGDMSLDLQPKLLRFLESGEISPLGEPTPFVVNARIIAATNSNLEGLVKTGKFREDLFYRLNVIRLSIKPLRERRDEIPTLINHFLMQAAEEFHKTQIRIAEETIERLVLYAWPGNVRQLQNEIRRVVALAEPGDVVRPDTLSPDIVTTISATGHESTRWSATGAPPAEKLNSALSRLEREMVKAALQRHHGKVDATAKALGISRKGLYLKRQRLGL